MEAFIEHYLPVPKFKNFSYDKCLSASGSTRAADRKDIGLYILPALLAK
jgi:hypothetical protein